MGSVGRTGLLGMAVLIGVSACHRRDASIPPAPGVLKVETGKQAKLDPEAALRCFVHGQFVGMQTPAECAGKNGVAPGALDVGLDQSGALAAGAGDTKLQSLSNAIADSDSATDAAGASADAGAGSDDTGDDDGGAPSTSGPAGDCMRYGPSGWRAAGHAVTLNVCVHTLFAGRCPGAGPDGVRAMGERDPAPHAGAHRHVGEQPRLSSSGVPGPGRLLDPRPMRVLPIAIRTIVAAGACILALAACAPQVEAPADAGVCWHMVSAKGKKARFYKVADHMPDLEHCAASLEVMRLHFLSLGGNTREVDGAYRGQFLFIDGSGVYTSTALNVTPYLALVPSGDGRLVAPGAMPSN